MLLKVDFNLEMFRWLFQSLYKRVLTTALENQDTEDRVKVRFISFLANDPTVYFLINLEETEITAHCIFTLQNGVAVIEQLEGDDTFILATLEYIKNNITSVTSISRIVNETEVDTYKTKYQFQVHKVGMVLKLDREVELNYP